MVAQAVEGLPTLHRYLHMRKRLLGIDGQLQYYDIYPSMFPVKSQPVFTLQQSEELTLAAIAPYGSEYSALLKRGFAGKWMDPYPRMHKTSGAYMNGSAYDVHPICCSITMTTIPVCRPSRMNGAMRSIRC